MAASAVDVITPAFERMKAQLFTRFWLWQWLRLALVGFLAGEMGSSGGCNANLPGDFSPNPAGSPGAPVLPPVLTDGSWLLIAAAIAVVVVVVLVVGTIFLYVSSRMRFVLFESVVRGECRIRESWRRYGGPAFRYFKWQFAWMVIALVAVATLIGVPIFAAYQSGMFVNPGDHLLPLIAGGILLFFTVALVFITLGVIHVLTKDFVVPQMALEELTALEGWRHLWRMMQSDKKEYAIYVGLKFVLALGAGIVTGIAGIIVMLIVLIPVGGAGIVAVLAGSAAGFTWNPVTIAIAVIVCIIVVLALILLMSLISVPVTVFFPAYSLHFFAERYLPLHQFMFPPSLSESEGPPVLS